jgi:hypothetical protein
VVRALWIVVACTACTNDFDALFGDASVRDTAAGETAVLDTSVTDTSRSDTSVTDAAVTDTAKGDSLPAPDVLADVTDAGCIPTTYSDRVKCDKPLAYLRFGETTGSTAKDEMGAHDGSYFGLVMLGAPGAISGNGAVHVAPGQYITLADDAAFAFAGKVSFTVEVWTKLDPIPDSGAGDNFHTLVAKHDSTVGGWTLRWSEMSETLSFQRFVSSSTYDAAYVNGRVMSDRFHHVVGVSDAAKNYIRLYIDGALAAEDSISAAIPTHGKDLRIGAQGAISNVRGTLDELAIYGRALSDLEVRAHFDAAK